MPDSLYVPDAIAQDTLVQPWDEAFRVSALLGLDHVAPDIHRRMSWQARVVVLGPPCVDSCPLLNRLLYTQCEVV